MENKADINSSTFITKWLLLVLFLSFGIFKVFHMFRVSESKEIQYIAHTVSSWVFEKYILF